ncbi:MAG: dTMP kinase [Advenella sp.]|jgi:dTMP kinase|uniref:dTMP kinase n=1 Tax=unclassified Advenella TaxID=2685285 RepID=UPI00145C83AE|nr:MULTISPECIES: dTMP kinase [unclassified Advenella]MDD3757817.1 dTMP kinase [Advenella sp.]NLN67212.1 dTMP kinase [Alcaligenaceae bacterium]
MTGLFITLEGVDGAGKSTHMKWLPDFFKNQGLDVVMTREPGGTPVGEKLREILLHDAMSQETEALLMFASRQENINQLIKPALAAGKLLLCDRFTDSTYAYQGGGRHFDLNKIAALENWVQEGLNPDLTLLFDVPLAVSRERLGRSGVSLDRFEQENDAFFEAVRGAYLQRAATEPHRFLLIDSTRPFEEVRAFIETRLLQFIRLKNNAST